jgi:chloride channel protein, CIC family
MTTATVERIKATSSTTTAWLATAAWAVFLGTASGFAGVAVRLSFRLLQWVFLQEMGTLPSAAAMLSSGRRVVTPMVGAALAIVVTRLAQRLMRGLQFEEYVEAVRLQGGRIPFISTAWRTLASAFSVATGASIGREGSMIQFAAAVISWVGARSPIRNLALAQQVAYGAAAAVAAVYQAPIAGVFFAIEIVLGTWDWENALPLLMASVSGWIVSRSFLEAGPLFPVARTLHLTLGFLWILPLAFLFGISGPAYQKLLHYSRVMKRLPLALLWSALLVGLLSIVEPKVWGNGDAALASLLQSNSTLIGVVSLLVFRVIATTACVGTGTVGGVFTPTLFAGAAAGLASAHLLHSQEPLVFAICGMGLLMAAVTHAPFMAALMAVELTGQWHLLPVIVPCTLIASYIARAISDKSLYGIASPEPAE